MWGVGKHFSLTVEDTGFEFHRLQTQIDAEAALDGIYVIRTNVPKKQMNSAEAARSYKALADLEHPATFDILTTPTPLQRRALELIDQITA